MHRRLGILLGLSLVWGLLSPARATAQIAAPAGAWSYTNPRVSPYLNLGVNSNGLSNYQTLVKPMLDEREVMERQARTTVRDPAQREPQKLSPQDQGQRGAKPRGGPSKAFLNLSHFYGSRQ